jgi:CheY-like chemotaxis protein
MKRSDAAKNGSPPGGSGGAHSLSSASVVLHVDDDPNDTILLEAAARKAKVSFLLQNVADGEAAIAYLDGSGIYADRLRYPVPSLILLDLKMPRATGFEVLQWIRAHADLRQIPVVVLSGSELQQDIQHAYNTGANSYLVKPLGFDALVSLVKSLNSLWLNVAAPGAGSTAY